MVEELGPSSEKKSFFVSKIITLVHFDAVFNRQKPWETDFTVQSRNEAYRNSANLSKNSRSHQEGRTISPLNTPLAIPVSFQGLARSA